MSDSELARRSSPWPIPDGLRTRRRRSSELSNVHGPALRPKADALYRPGGNAGVAFSRALRGAWEPSEFIRGFVEPCTCWPHEIRRPGVKGEKTGKGSVCVSWPQARDRRRRAPGGCEGVTAGSLGRSKKVIVGKAARRESSGRSGALVAT